MDEIIKNLITASIFNGITGICFGIAIIVQIAINIKNTEKYLELKNDIDIMKTTIGIHHESFDVISETFLNQTNQIIALDNKIKNHMNRGHTSYE